MKDLIEQIAKSLVDYPELVNVNSGEGISGTVLEIRAHPSDLGRVIGRDGRAANAMRTLLGAAGARLHHRFTLVVVNKEHSQRTAV